MSVVLYEKKDHIAHIRLNRPESLNAVNRELAQELAKIWRDFKNDKDLWVGIVSGEGRSFCAGADVKELQPGNWEFSKSLIFGDDRLAPSNYDVWKPLIAAVHGHVYGAGFWIALECDIRIAANNARFGIPEGKIGLVTLFAPFLANYLPRGVAADLLLSGDPIDAERAYQLGLVSKVVPPEQLLSAATKMAEAVMSNSPLATFGTKELMCRTQDMDRTSAIALIEQIATRIFNLKDTVEARRAFIEKRKPEWKLR
ncbi:MAG: enoyl-CoA hydratase-related protein [Pseudomonadota bacterium]